MEKLLSEPETARFGFDSFDCVRDLAADPVKFLDNGPACHNRGFIESYKEFEVDLVLRVRIDAGSQVYDLLFNPIPPGVLGNYHADKPATAFDFCGWPLEVGTEWGQHGMIIGISQRLQCVQEIIPSIVRIERSKERVHFPRNIRASSLDLRFKFGSTMGKREVGVPNLGLTGGGCDRVDCVVETGAEIAHDVANEFRNESIVKILNELDLVKELVRGSWVYFNDLSVGVYLDESLNFPLEIGEMFASSSNLALRAVEWSRHFPDCTNLKPLFQWGSEQLRRTPTTQLSPLLSIACQSRQQPWRASFGGFCESE